VCTANSQLSSLTEAYNLSHASLLPAHQIEILSLPAAIVPPRFRPLATVQTSTPRDSEYLVGISVHLTISLLPSRLPLDDLSQFFASLPLSHFEVLAPPHTNDHHRNECGEKDRSRSHPTHVRISTL
jgi:hypothetical protein